MEQMDPALLEEIADGPPEEEIEVVLRLREPGEVPPGVRVVDRFGEVVTGRVRRRDVRRVHDLDEVASVKADLRVHPADAAGGDDGGGADAAGGDDGGAYAAEDEAGDETPGPTDGRRPASDPAAGRGVVLAVLDWSFDLPNPAFRHPDGRTRVAACWLQGAPAGPGRVPAAGYGRVLLAPDIDRCLQADDPYAALDYRPWDAPDARFGTHGTHVASIAAGTPHLGVSGVASAADLVLVHLSDPSPRRPGAGLGTSVSLLEALAFVDRVAGDRPCVVNISAGRHAGDHRGESLVERALDEFVTRRPGRSAFQSAGNYYQQQVHAAVELAPGEQRSVRWLVEPGDPTPNELEAWYSGRDELHVALRSPDGDEVSVSLGDSAELRRGGELLGRVYHRRQDPNSGFHQLQAFLRPTAPAGAWEVVLTGVDVTDGRVHLWVERDHPRHQSRFAAQDAVRTVTLGSIACGFSTVAVGAVDAHAPGNPVTAFSSCGPTADGRRRPTLLAAGYRVLAARSAAGPDGPDRLVRKSGTSMAAPAAAGAAACLYEAAGRPLSVAEVRHLLVSTLAPAPDVDEPYRAGAGVLDLDRLLAAARALPTRPAPAVALAEAPQVRRTRPSERRESTVTTLFAPRALRAVPSTSGALAEAAPVETVAVPGTETEPGGLWVPGAERLAHAKAAGLPYIATAPWRFVVHTIEAEPSVAAFRALAARHTAPPHLWAMPSADLLLQVIPLDRAAFALAHPTGTPHTNRMHAVQVEIWGYARDSASTPGAVLDWLADRVLAPVARLVPIDLGTVRATGGTECYGQGSGCRMSAAEWAAFSGVCGHQHVPDNAHWDPGRLDLGRIAARAAAAIGGARSETAEPEVDAEIHGEAADAVPAAEVSRSSSARLEWTDLTMTPGGDGRPHLYYLTSGPPGGGPSRFRLKVTNTNDHYNLKNPTLRVRLRARTGPEQSRVVPLEGQGDAPWKTISSSDVPDESSRTIELFLDGATRWRAYDPDQPLRWLDLEYHWYEGVLGRYSSYYTTTNLGFFLVAPAELMLRSKRLVAERALDDPAEHRAYWRLLWQNSDPRPAQYSLSLQASVSDQTTGQVSVTTSGTVTRGTERSEQVSTTSELSVGFGIDKMFSLGQKLGTTVTSGIRWSESVARTLTLVASRTRAFTEGHAEQFQISGQIPAAPAGKKQTLYAYPVVGVYEVPVVLFGAANELGQATRRQADRVPVVWLRGWGTKVVLT